MAIESFGLATSPTGAAGSSIKVSSAATPSGVWLRWHTLTGAGTIKAFDLAVSYQRVQTAAKGASEPQYGGWSDWFYEQVPVADCSPVADSTGYSWSHTLDLAGLYAKAMPHGLGYSTRDNDEMHLQLKVKAVYESSFTAATGQEVSDVVYAEAWIGWIPTYTVSSASFGASGDLKITFGRPGWTRTDDRYTFEVLSQSGQTLLGSVTGKVGGGTVTVPHKSLRRMVQAGTLTYRVRIDASYKASGYALTKASGTVAVADNSTSSTVAISLKQSGTALVATVTDSGDKTVKSTKATVKLRGLWQDYDTFEVSVPGTVTFDFPPLDKTVYVDAKGKGTDAYSKMSTATATVKSNGRTYLQRRDEPSAGFALYYDLQSTKDVKPEVETLKLAGRKRSTAYYGVGAEVTEQMQGKLIDMAGIEQGTPDTACDVVAGGGVLVVRRPGGARGEYAATALSTKRGPVSPVVTVNVELTEVV